MSDDTTKPTDRVAVATACLAFVAFLVLSFWLLDAGHLHEDAYILFTYAEHLAAGDGIVYFAGGEHAEGATDFLWMVALALLDVLGLDIAYAAALINAIGMGLLGYLLMRNLPSKDPAARTIAAVLVVAMLLASEIAAAAAAGFSTAIYAAVAVSIVHLCLNASTSRLTLLPWVSILLGLLRPDGVIFGVAACLVGLALVWRSPHRNRYLTALVGAGVCGVVYFGWRLSYFGHTLPLPLYVKSHGSEVLPGLRDVVEYLREHWPLVIVGALAFPFVRDRKRYILAFLPVGLLLTSFAFGHLTQNIGYRFQAPVTAALMLSMLLFFGRAFKNAGRVLKVAPVALAVSAVSLIPGESADIYEFLTRKDYISSFPYLAGDILDEETTVALTEAGRMAYWNDAKTFDLVGLNTAHVAIQKLDTDYLAQLDPDVIFVHTAGSLERFPDPGSTLEASFETIEEKTRPGDWREIDNPTRRAPYVVYEHLANNPGRYDLVFARYGESFSHLYAVKRGGEVSWPAFLARLKQSFSAEAAMSYRDIKKTMD